ncbi:MAG: hypothetical protein KatS3mg109_1121 [Pirellulaceae bacterium]|nr:MAG: hypothetical protein KatS3mg109_1121 [Pirellulaceae bacterium]GIW93084.1 MAG: hypothetical protein KatS3mg110_1125 [Pirellulaceae bacterium]
MHDPQHIPPIFRIDVSAETAPPAPAPQDADRTIIALLKQILAAQERQNQLLAELNQHLTLAHRQRLQELALWKDAHPDVARYCRMAAEALSRVQTQFLKSMAVEAIENEEHLADGDFMLHEFVDRYGPRLAHLNALLQVFSQLGSGQTPNT